MPTRGSIAKSTKNATPRVKTSGAHAFRIAALLAVVATVVYWPALSGGFLLDDDTLLTESVLVKAADGLRRMWLTTEPLDYWPLTNTSFWLEWRLWGMAPTGYHVTNLALHVWSATLIWAILRRLSIPGALIAALLFVVHPVNVESVAWIAQRKNTLSMALFLLSIWWFIRATPDLKVRGSVPKVGGSVRLYWLSLAAFVFAMLSKGSVAVLPAVLLLIVWWKHGTVTRGDVVRVAPFFAVSIALTLVNIWFQTHYTTAPIRDVTLLERALGAGGIVWFYLYKALLPINLVFIYPQWTIQADDVRWWLPLAAAIIVTAVLIWQRRRPVARALLCAWLFFGLALAPVMGWTDVYFMKFSLVADHYAYIAVIGVVACVAAGLARLPPATSWVVVAVLGLLTFRQSTLYGDPERLYRATLAANPSTWLAHNDLGVLLADRSVSEAIAHFREAVRLQPDQIEPQTNLCHTAARVGLFDDAITACSAAIRINPNLAATHNDLGGALASRGRLDAARPEFEAAVKLDPGYADAHINLANVLAMTGRDAEAIAHYREAIRLAPGAAAARMNLGLALENQGRMNEAVTEYREALRLDPTLAQARNRLDALNQTRPR
jgi:Flp pilus assembly protein TadD